MAPRSILCLAVLAPVPLAVPASQAPVSLRVFPGATPELVYDYDGLYGGAHVFANSDLPVRAFRGADGDIQLVLPQSGVQDVIAGPGHPNETIGGNVRLKGADFDSLEVTALAPEGFVMESSIDGAICKFNDAEWLASVWRDEVTNDIHGLVHVEIETQRHTSGEEHFPGGESASCDYCSSSTDNCCNGTTELLGFSPGDLWLNAVLPCQITCITAAVSTDDGESYEQQLSADGAAPLVMHGAYMFYPHPSNYQEVGGEWVPTPTARAPYSGYTVPSNIVQPPGSEYYYVLVKQQLPPLFKHHAESSPQIDPLTKIWAGGIHTVLARTDDLSDTGSWMAFGNSFSGADPLFDVPFVNPYRQGEPTAGANLLDNVPYPLNPFWHHPAGTLTVSTLSGSLIWITSLERWIAVDHAKAVIDGEVRRTVAYSTSEDLITWSELRHVPSPVLTFDQSHNPYPALIDHTSTRVNFDWSGQTPYLYYTDDLDLYRIRMLLDTDEQVFQH